MNKYKFKSSVKFYLNESLNELHMIFLNEHKEHVVEIDSVSLHLLELVGQEMSIKEIYDNLILKHENVSIDDVKDQIEFLLDLNVVQIIPEKTHKNFNEVFLSRQTNFFTDFTTIDTNEHEVQKILTNSNVVIVGVGAIGSWIAYNLVQSGIGKLTIIDADEVSLSNLSRQALYFHKDIGQLKVDILAKRLTDINPEVKVTKIKKFINDPKDLEVINDKVDIMINCSDQPNAYTTGMLVTNFCIPRNIPHINGIGYRGNICRLGTTTIPKKTMCWNCIYQNKEWSLNNLKEMKFGSHIASAGSISSLTSLIASMHSWEALKVLLPIFSPSMTNKTGELNFQDLTIQWNEESQDADCVICNRKPEETLK